MKLNTGKVFFNIKFDNGDETNISFNPHDREFIKRIKNFEKNINNKINELNIAKYKDRIQNAGDIDFEDFDKLISMNDEQVSKIQDKIDALQELDEEYQNIIKNELDNIFKAKVSDKIFKYCEPLDIITYESEEETKSELFVMHFLREFFKELNARRKDISPEMKKYIGRYES